MNRKSFSILCSGLVLLALLFLSIVSPVQANNFQVERILSTNGSSAVISSLTRLAQGSAPQGAATQLAHLAGLAAGIGQTADNNLGSRLGWFLNPLRNLITLLLVGLLGMWLFPNLIKESAEQLQTHPFPSLGWGLISLVAFFLILVGVVLVAVAVTMFFTVITLGGLAWSAVGLGSLLFSALLVLFNLCIAYFSKIVVSYLIGHLILARFLPNAADARFWPLILGLVIIVLLVAIPFVGWFINWIVVIFGLGAIWEMAYGRLRHRQPVAELTPA